jgi:uncharacterized membrane protein YfhO
MRLSEILAKEGLDDEEVDDGIDLKGILKELKEIMKLNAEMQQKQQQPILNKSQNTFKGFENKEIPKLENKEIPKEENKEIAIKTNALNRTKFKENLKEVLTQYKDNDAISSFSIKDGINFLFSNEQYFDLAVNVLIDIYEKSKE